MIPLYQVFALEGIETSIANILQSGSLSYGAFTKTFEQDVSHYIDNRYFLATNTFNNAMIMALHLADVCAGDEVITSPMSCLATNQPISSRQARVVWADVDPQTGTIDPKDLVKKISPRTKALVHYHWAGYPGYIDEINDIAKEAGIKVIEDASESFGSRYKGARIGSTGTDIVCFSFQTVRFPNTIDGGGLAFNNKELYEECCLMRDYGIDRDHFRDELGEIDPTCDVVSQGYGATMGNISAHIGSRQLEKVSEILSTQRRNAATWDKYFANRKSATPIDLRGEIQPNYWVYSVFASDRQNLLLMFREQGFSTSKLHGRNDIYSVFSDSNSNLVGVDEFSSSVLCLPAGWWFNLSRELELRGPSFNV